MFIGKWNKSVILTYIGLFFSVFGIFMCFKHNINLAMSALIMAGICDLFDGTVARRCKRTEEEKNFGIQLDSLVDVVSFIVFPISIFISIGFNTWFHLLIMFIFAICGIARLAYFNISIEDNSSPVKYYTGLPVTFSAMIFPIFYLLIFIIPNIFYIVYTIIILLVAILNILSIKIKKPKGIAYIIFSLLAIFMLIVYLGVLR